MGWSTWSKPGVRWGAGCPGPGQLGPLGEEAPAGGGEALLQHLGDHLVPELVGEAGGIQHPVLPEALQAAQDLVQALTHHLGQHGGGEGLVEH
jgi:hypothetical protein